MRAEALEDAMAARLEARHAIAVASPLVAFHLAYRALGHRAGATLATTSLADPTVVRAAMASGFAVGFVDVDWRGHLEPAALPELVALRGVPAVIVASHHAGHPCRIRGVADAAAGALVIEDAVDALGAAAADGVPVGSPRHAAMTVVGLHPVSAAAPAQGGVLLTDDVTLAARCRRLRDERTEHRLSALHATLALVELGRLDALLELRARVAARYDEALGAHRLATPVAPPPSSRSAWPSYLVRVPAWLRNDVRQALRARGIGGHRLSMLLHRHPYFGRHAVEVELPATERFAAETLVLPTGALLHDAQVRRVADVLATIGTPDAAGVALAG